MGTATARDMGTRFSLTAIFYRMAVLLGVSLTLCAFLFYNLSEKVHEQYFISSLFSTAEMAQTVELLQSPAETSQEADGSYNETLAEKLRIAKISLLQASIFNTGIGVTNSKLPDSLELSLAIPTGSTEPANISQSTNPSLIGKPAPNSYKLKKFEIAEIAALPFPLQYATDMDKFQVVTPITIYGEKSLDFIVTLPDEVVRKGYERRRQSIIYNWISALLFGQLLVLISLVLVSLLNRRTTDSPNHSNRFIKPVQVIWGASILLASVMMLWGLTWVSTQTELHALETSSKLLSLQVSTPFLSFLSDNITVILITGLSTLELSILLFSRFNHRTSEGKELAFNLSFKAMRPAIFLFLFGIDLALSIIPLQMERLYEPLPGFSRELVLGLPITLEFLFVGIAILFSGAWLDRKGWAEPFIAGLLLTILGGVYSALAPNYLHFLVARALLGFGYGLTLLAAQGFIVSKTDSKSKAQGLSHLFAGLYSGSICGAATGAIIAERFGYEVVFLAGAVTAVIVILYGVYVLDVISAFNPKRKMESPENVHPKNSQLRSIVAFLLDKRIVSVTLLSSLPASIAVVGFLHYFTPVYLSQKGIAESQIGQVLILFGICLTLLGPPIGRLIDKYDNKKIPIFIGGLLGSSAFLLFMLGQNIMAVTVAIILLGVSNSFVLSSQSAYVLQLDISKNLGEGKALGIFRATSRLGQMLGPLLFAALLGLKDTQAGIVWFGVVYLLVVLLFQLLVKKERSVKSHPPIETDTYQRSAISHRTPGEISKDTP